MPTRCYQLNELIELSAKAQFTQQRKCYTIHNSGVYFNPDLISMGLIVRQYSEMTV